MLALPPRSYELGIRDLPGVHFRVRGAEHAPRLTNAESDWLTAWLGNPRLEPNGINEPALLRKLRARNLTAALCTAVALGIVPTEMNKAEKALPPTPAGTALSYLAARGYENSEIDAKLDITPEMGKSRMKQLARRLGAVGVTRVPVKELFGSGIFEVFPRPQST